MAGLSSSGFGVSFNFKATGVDHLKRAVQAQRDNIAQMQIGKQMNRLLGISTKSLSMDILQEREKLIGLNQTMRSARLEEKAMAAQHRQTQMAYAAVGAALLMAGARAKSFLQDTSRAAAEYESMLNKIAVMTGETAADMEAAGIGDKIHATAKATMTSHAQVAEAMTGFLKAGDNMEKASGRVETAMGLMAIAEMNAGSATRALVKINNLFKEQLDAFPDGTKAYVSGLVAADRASVATANEIQDMTERTASAVKMFGLGVDHTMAMSAAVLDLGGKVERSGTAMQNMFLAMKMRAPEMAKALGMSVAAFNTLPAEEKLMRLLETVDKMQQGGMGGAEALKKLTKAMGMPGTRGTETLMKLAEATRKAEDGSSLLGDRLNAVRDAMGKGTLAAEAMAEKQKTWAFRLHNFRLEWEKFKASIGASVNAIFGPVISAATWLLSLFQMLPEPIRHMVGGLMVFGTVALVALGTAAMAAGGLAFVIGLIDRRLEGMASKSTFDGMAGVFRDATKRMGGAYAAFSARVAAGNVVMKTSVGGVASWIATAFTGVMAKISQSMSTHLPASTHALGRAAQYVRSALAGILLHFAVKFPQATIWAQRLAQAVRGVSFSASFLLIPLALIVGMIMKINKHWDMAILPFEKYRATVDALWRGFAEGEASVGQMDLLKKLGLVGFWAFLSDIGAGIRSFWDGFMEPLSEAGEGFDMFAGAVGAVGAAIADAFNPIINIFREQLGTQGMGFILDGLKIVGRGFGYLAKLAGGILLVSLLALAGALKLIVGLAVTVGLAIAVPFRVVWSVVKNVTLAVMALGAMLFGIGQGLMGGGWGLFITGFKDLANAILGPFEDLLSAVGDVLLGLLNSVFSNLGKGAVDAVKNAYHEVKQWLGLESKPGEQPGGEIIDAKVPLAREGELGKVPFGPQRAPITLADRGGRNPKNVPMMPGAGAAPVKAAPAPVGAAPVVVNLTNKTNVQVGDETITKSVKEATRKQASRNGTMGTTSTRGVGG